MGCITGKIPGCLEDFSEIDENIESIVKVHDIYREVLKPYRIKDSLAPILTLTIVTLEPLTVPHQVLRSKDFPVFSHTIPQLVSCAAEIFAQFNLDSLKLSSFLDLVSRNYFTNLPFHNFRHGFSVLQMIFVIGERNSSFTHYISNQDYLYLLLAALGHDICHPGLNNAYLIASKHDLALQYNNESVLENHHASVILNLIRFSGLLGETDFTYLKEIIYSTILSTDMTRHKEVCYSFERSQINYDKSKKNSRLTFMNFVLHSADLGNQSLDFSIAVIWSLKIVQEFNQQVACEELSGIKVSEFMRIGNDIEKIKKSQIGFIDFAILPLWTGLVAVVNHCEDFEESIKANREKWNNLKTFESLTD